jgi:hypothetical protein
MAKKIEKRSKKVAEIFTGTQVGVLLEHLENKIDVVIESYGKAARKMDKEIIKYKSMVLVRAK